MANKVFYRQVYIIKLSFTVNKYFVHLLSKTMLTCPHIWDRGSRLMTFYSPLSWSSTECSKGSIWLIIFQSQFHIGGYFVLLPSKLYQSDLYKILYMTSSLCCYHVKKVVAITWPVTWLQQNKISIVAEKLLAKWATRSYIIKAFSISIQLQWKLHLTIFPFLATILLHVFT